MVVVGLAMTANASLLAVCLGELERLALRARAKRLRHQLLVSASEYDAHGVLIAREHAAVPELSPIVKTAARSGEKGATSRR